MLKKQFSTLVVVTALSLLLLATPLALASTLVQGPSQEVFGATVVAWARIASNGRIVEAGITVPLESIVRAAENGPTHGHAGEGGLPEPVAVLEFPAEVRSGSWLDHVQLHWEPAGHPPGVYQVPHFDFHFYGVPIAAVRATDCSDPTLPAQDVLVPGYVLPPPDQACVPYMGVHALPVGDLQLQGPFQQTLILGYYGGQLTFIEPMITRQLLLAKVSFSREICGCQRQALPEPDPRRVRSALGVVPYLPHRLSRRLTRLMPTTRQ